MSALGFTAVAALHHEAADQATHGAHLTNMMLFVYAMWYQLYSPEIRAAVAERRFWSPPLFPHWAYVLSLFSVGLFYGLSGWSKLAQGGLYWPNGLSLQLWVALWGDANSFWTGLILSSRTIARLLQLVTLALELGTPLVTMAPGSRRLIGLGLIALHVGIASVLGFGFHANAAIIAMVLVVQTNWLFRLGETPRPGEV